MDYSINNEYLSSALEEGIGNEAIVNSIEGVMNKSDEKGFVPKQFGKMIDMLISAKQGTNEFIDNTRLSFLVRNNMGKLDALLNDGLTPSEVSMSFARQITKNNPEDSKFLTGIYSKIKKREFALKKAQSKEIQHQKVIIKFD